MLCGVRFLVIEQYSIDAYLNNNSRNNKNVTFSEEDPLLRCMKCELLLVI